MVVVSYIAIPYLSELDVPSVLETLHPLVFAGFQKPQFPFQ